MKKNPGELPPLVPDDAATRSLGRITLLIASVLLAGNLYTLSSYMALPLLKPLGLRAEKWGNGFLEAQMKAQIARVEQKKAATKDPALIGQYDAQIAALQKNKIPKINSMSMGFSGMDNPQVMMYGLVDSAVGLVFNTVLLLGAAGLTGLKGWGYRTSRWMACLKLGRLVVFTVLMMTWILPIQIKDMREKLAEALAGQGGPAPPGLNADGLAAASTSSIVFFALMAAAYPIIMLVQLRKPRIKAACGIVPRSESFDGGLA